MGNLRKKKIKDSTVFKNLIRILKEMIRKNPAEGIGKPELLRHNLSGCWSRRITQKDRLIYKFDDSSIYILAIGGHYDDK